MSLKERVVRYLEEQYGITTGEQLEKAIAELPLLDISLFVAPIPMESKTSQEIT